MPDFPTKLYYAKTHEWVNIEGTRATIGISDYAQTQLGDIVYVELPEAGLRVQTGDEVAVVESVKAASDIYAPVSGTVVECNQALEDTPESVNAQPYDDGWFLVIQMDDPIPPSGLLDATAYEAFCEEDGE